ncbi:phage portal protein [Terrihalobacillus insolitus]|uniref:phage portal protein n=1 Tax=Terrihalobacillus insolitus TaxID=2950438 RepID=UPI002342173B|nr:phage portal protein [Terrihalobacillus insolitus]MDC3413971.1 phage portal protein [Terrihalobacillus insolitus]
MMFEKGGYYPPIGHKKRIIRYNENKLLFVGKHYDVFERYQNLPSDSLYLSVNLAGLICKKSGDFLFGESPTFSAGKQDDSPEQKKLDEWVHENNLNMKLQQSATANAFRGDSFFKIRWGQKWGGKVPQKFDPFRIIIEPQNPKYVFPETSSGDASTIEAYHIAFPTVVKGSGDQDWILNIESHYPNKIVYRKFEMYPFETRGIDVVEWKIGNEIKKEYREVETGVPFPLVVHIPNYATDDDWEGIDDLSEHKPLFDELNRRLTKIAEILDKHADPAIAVPTGVLGEDENGNPTFIVGRDKVFEVMGKDDVVPQYITWNGQLQSAFEEIDRIVEMILTNAEIPAVALGKGDSGTSGNSGLAIKFRMNSLLAKINRKRQFYEKGLKELFMICQLIERVKKGNKAGYDFFDVKIHFKDGLPQDDAELANIMNVRTGGKATISQKTALMRLDGLTEEQAEAELKRMEEEAEAEAEKTEKMFANPSIFNTQVDKGNEGEAESSNDGE